MMCHLIEQTTRYHLKKNKTKYQDRNANNLVGGNAFAVIGHALWCLDDCILEGKKRQSKLNGKSNETTRVEDELVSRGVLVADKCVQAFHLRRRRKNVQ